ncbi:MAG: peptidylprolyl isomerase, partial [Candidatus Krumholzibacteria bacterium]|nr:peptidylprolyl isomerase [Candidatus Krumholzibacteria bacterium]
MTRPKRRPRGTAGVLVGVALLVMAALVGTGCERRPMTAEKDPSPVLVKVNQETLTEREFRYFLPEDYRNVLTSEELQEYLDRWITTQLLYDAGMKSGLVVVTDIEARLEQYRKDLVADQLVQQVIHDRAMVSDKEIRAYYEAHEREYVTDVRVSHILVNTLEEAEKVQSQIGKRSFTYLARKYSIDKHSGSGGDLGYLSKGSMIPEFESVVFGLKLGEVSGVIESEFGYHLVKVADIRDARYKLEF